MTNTPQQSVVKMRLGAAGAALTFVVVLVLGAATQSAQAQTFTNLYNFKDGSDGGFPYAALVRDKVNNLYGTTAYGGDPSCTNYNGCGTVFKVDTSGNETVLYSFTGPPDGAYPYAGLVQDAAGNLYGTTESGGASGYGVVFKVDTSGNETVLHSFAGPPDGCGPYGGLLRDAAGNLYGTTAFGGKLACGDTGAGTVFKVDTSGNETVLHSFAGGSYDGAYPILAGLLMDISGNLYGTTDEGGDLNCGDGAGCGVVYKLSKSGKLTVLHRFTGGTADGCGPLGTPAMDKNDNLYGTTLQCGSSSLGIVWKVSRKGTETVLHNFAGGVTDGAYPPAAVIMDAKGNLYGDTANGGPYNYGTVYKLSERGRLTLLHSFAGSDGQTPQGSVIRDAKGTLYGTTQSGGDLSCNSGYGCGTVWKLTP